MEINNLGLQTELKPLAQNELDTLLDNLGTQVHEMREALASVGMTTLACGSKACNLTNLDNNMPDVCILDLMDWLDELAQEDADKHGNLKSRVQPLNSMIEMIIRKVEPISNAPYGRHDLPFLARSMAHPRVQVALEDLHNALSKVAEYEVTSQNTERKAA